MLPRPGCDAERTSEVVSESSSLDRRAWEIRVSPGTVDIRAVVDPQDLDLSGGVIDLVENSVRTAASAECPGELALERLAYAPGIASEISIDEFNDRRNYSRRYA